MSKMFNLALPAALLISTLFMLACATKPEIIPVAAPVQVETIVEKTTAQEIAPESASAPPVDVTEQPSFKPAPTPKPKAHKIKKKAAKKVEPVTPPLAPVAEPAPVVERKIPTALTPDPSLPVVVAPKEEPGFFEHYWLWVVALIVLIVGIFVWMFKSRK